jgi:hypothetical protein
MDEVQRAGTLELLEQLHTRLDIHFRQLYERRKALDPVAPVFALEHALSRPEVSIVQAAIRAAHTEHVVSRAASQSWLPFVVHAAEVGYAYDGIEFWPIYASSTPGWLDSEYERDRVRAWFTRFAREYGGAVPSGAWATTFRKIAWPITHAVLPRYLQVQLARMLSDYRAGWPSLLDDPMALGVRLHSWSYGYSDRLEKFCQNTALVGHVAIALLLSGDGHESPYIESLTLGRLVESLNSERQSRRWLENARRSANVVRTRHFQSTGGFGPGRRRDLRGVATDPRLQLRHDAGKWSAYLVLPDLRPLQHILPSVYDEMRIRRATISGAKASIPTGGLLFSNPPLELTSWPSPDQPVLQLQNAPDDVNLLVADQCRISSGPWWVFRHTPGEPPAEVKGKFVRPGGAYYLVGTPDATRPAVTWCTEVAIATDGVVAFDLRVPSAIRESDAAALVAAGISVHSEFAVRPVGIVPSDWDGEGSFEWLAGEPALVAISAQSAPDTALLTIDSEPYHLEWPAGQTELFLSLSSLEVGTYEIAVSLPSQDGATRASGGAFTVTIRDPQIRAAGASLGEGIRMRTMPAQPTLPELWDGQATVEIDGPVGAVDLSVALFDGMGRELRTHQRTIDLPVSGDTWRQAFGRFREAPELAKHYDEADVAEVSVSRAGVGFAKLTCERGFHGLRWVVAARHEDSGYTARLIDRTDGDEPIVTFFSVEHPFVGVSQPPYDLFVAPPRGGLLWAANAGQTAGQIIPPDPNQLIRLGIANPAVPIGNRSLVEVEKLMRRQQQWKDAELPAHPFGVRERQRVLDAFTSATARMLTAGRWATFEQQIIGVAASDVDLSRAQTLVGENPDQRAAAKSIASNLWRWGNPDALVRGFSAAITELATSAGMPNPVRGARFLLKLATSPADLLDWEDAERSRYLRCVLSDPVLMRAARFTILGLAEDFGEGGS